LLQGTKTPVSLVNAVVWVARNGNVFELNRYAVKWLN